MSAPEHQPDSTDELQASIKRTQETAQTAQKQILEGVAASQQWILESVKARTEAVTPVPGLDREAATKDIHRQVDEAFDFSEQLLASQREFTHKLVAASTPLTAK